MHIHTSSPAQKKGHMRLGINYTIGIHSPYCKYSVIEGSKVPQVSGHRALSLAISSIWELNHRELLFQSRANSEELESTCHCIHLSGQDA